MVDLSLRLKLVTSGASRVGTGQSDLHLFAQRYVFESVPLCSGCDGARKIMSQIVGHRRLNMAPYCSINVGQRNPVQIQVPRPYLIAKEDCREVCLGGTKKRALSLPSR